MYFAVFLVEAGEYAIVPKNWILMDGKSWTGIVNYGIKKNKKYICYYSTRENALLNDYGEPNTTFLPNFDAPRTDQYPSEEGTFLCRLLMYSRKLLLHF